jgi:hypothetical protein
VRRLGRLAGVEPSAFSGGSLTMRAIPTLPTEDEGSHHGLRRRQWGRARAGDEEADTKNVDKVRGGNCGAHLASVPLPAMVVAAPLPQRPRR